MKAILRALYRLIPFKRHIYSFMREVWTPPESVFKHLHFTGIITIPVDDRRSFRMRHYGFQIENEIFWAGLANGWEKESIKLWIRLCQDAATIVDVGANTGVYSLIAKTVKPAARVFAFEPVTRVYHKLRENIDLNGFDIVGISKAVSNRNGTAVIYDTLSDHVLSVTVNRNLNSADTAVIETPVDTITLDSFITQQNITRIDLIKIDVETHEPEVLEGYSEFLARHKPSMLIEVLNDEIGQRVHAIVKDLGYLYFTIDERGGVREVERVRRSDYYNYLLCSPDVARRIGLTPGL